MTKNAAVRSLSAQEARKSIPDLSAILIDCVEGGDSVGFMAPLTREKAGAFWRGVAEGIAASERILLVAEDRASGEIFGTVQVVFGQPENQPHRADVAKTLVHRRARGRGLGTALMRAAEDVARASGRTLLVLDTASSDAERLYEHLGWTRVGQVPGYALMPDGRPCDTTIFYKPIAQT
jgi:GNAT superfamily N-acetyltransferase